MTLSVTGHTGAVAAMACTKLDGRPIAITASDDRTVRVWDLTDGTLHTTLTGHTDAVAAAVACTELDGRPVALSGSADGTVRVWDLLAIATTAHAMNNSNILATTCTELKGRPVALSGSADGTVQVWDLIDGSLHITLTARTAAVRAVACTKLDGHPIAITGSDDRTVRVWDLIDGGSRAGRRSFGRADGHRNRRGTGRVRRIA